MRDNLASKVQIRYIIVEIDFQIRNNDIYFFTNQIYKIVFMCIEANFTERCWSR